MSNQQNDFRGHTCGECAWFIPTADEAGAGPCRKDPRWNNTYSDVPACPAFVPREEEKP